MGACRRGSENVADLTFFTDERAKILLDTIAVEGPKVATNLLLLGVGWLIGKRLSIIWSERQKLREQDLVAARDFHLAYGDFFATWKLWNYHLQMGKDALPESSRWKILERACQAEAKLEATLIRLASERALSKAESETLGRFRQLFQTLRESIRDNKRLDWNHSEHPQYSEFKRLAPKVAAIIGRLELTNESQLQKITSNIFEPSPRCPQREDM